MSLTPGATEKQKSLAEPQTLLGLRFPAPVREDCIWHQTRWRQRTSVMESVSLSCPGWLRIYTRGLWKLPGRERACTLGDVPVLSKPCLVTKGIPEKAWRTYTPVLLSLSLALVL